MSNERNQPTAAEPDALSGFQKPWYRRRFLKTAGLLGASALIPSVLRRHDAALLADGHNGEPDHDENLAHRVQDQTAIGVAGTFAGVVGASALAPKHFGFGHKTILPVSGMEWLYRVPMLRKYDPHGYEHEMHEHAVSYPLIAGLGFAAELASHASANVEALLEKDRKHLRMYKSGDLADKLALDEMRAKKHVVEDMRYLSIDDLEKRHAGYGREVVGLAAANAALSTVLAPFVTTYTSASAVMDSLPAMHSVLTKSFYTQQLLEAKRGEGEISNEREAEILRSATEKATDAINNNIHGYANLILSHAANISGMSLAGDPPMIASFLLNGLDVPQHLKTSAEGEALAIATSAQNHILWLRTLGIDAGYGDLGKGYISNLFEAGSEFFKSGFVGDVRNASWWGRSNAAQRIAGTLDGMAHTRGVDESSVRFLRNTLHQLHNNTPFLQLDIPGFAREKGEVAQHAWDRFVALKDKVVTLLQSRNDPDTGIADTFAEGDIHAKITSLAALSPEDRLKELFALDTDITSKNTAQLTEVLLQIMRGDGSEDTNVVDDLAQSAANAVASPKDAEHLIDQTAEEIAAIEGDIQGMSSDELTQKLRLLGKLGPKEVQNALNAALVILGQTSGADEHEDHGPQLLGHSAQEVVSALLTQLPAVPSLVHLSDGYIRKAFNLADGAVLSKADLRKVVAIILTTTAGLSGVADNVAAYLFGRKLLESVLQLAYGDEYQSNTDLKQYANDAALFVSVAAGALTKIGNGPNFLIKKISCGIHDRELQHTTEDISLAKSIANQYAWLQTGEVIGYEMLRLLQLPEPTPPTTDDSPSSASPKTRTRREILFPFRRGNNGTIYDSETDKIAA